MDQQLSFAQLEHLQSKYVGTGNADTTPAEWLRTQERDTVAKIVGHHNVLYYMATGAGKHTQRLRYELLEV